MISTQLKHGLKEWAVVVEALREGRQILLLRKGGIHEPRGELKAAHSEFFFFPTFVHQKPELLKPEAAERNARLLDPAAEERPLRIDTLAELVEVVELEDGSRARRLSPEHVWSEAYIEMRLSYKPERPLLVFLVRAYALPSVLEVARLKRYDGCRSWLDFDRDLPAAGARPVLGDKAFAARVRRVKECLGAPR